MYVSIKNAWDLEITFSMQLVKTVTANFELIDSTLTMKMSYTSIQRYNIKFVGAIPSNFTGTILISMAAPSRKLMALDETMKNYLRELSISESVFSFGIRYDLSTVWFL